jgi:beta-lactamase class A
MITRRRFAIGMGAGLIGGLIGRTGSPHAAGVLSDGLRQDFMRIEAGIRARLGVAVLDTSTGQRISHRGGERFPLCSTFKLLASAAVLKRVDAGQEHLSRRIRFEASDLVTGSPVTNERVGGNGMTLGEICEAAMTRSDNTAGNLILKSLGGPEGMTAFARSIGDNITRLDRWETDLNESIPGDPRDTTTPDIMAANVNKLVLGDHLSPRCREQLTRWMIANKTGNARLRAGLPKDWRIGDKTGTGERGSTNDVAVVWPSQRAPLIICVYMTETEADFDQRNAAIAEVGRSVKAAFGA